MATESRPKKQDSDYVFYELTRSICPRCLEPIDAQILIKDGRVDHAEEVRGPRVVRVFDKLRRRDVPRFAALQ